MTATLRQKLIKLLENTGEEYFALVEQVPFSLYHAPSGNPGWSMGEILQHITVGPQVLLLDVWIIRHVGWFPPLPVGLFSQINGWLPRLTAKGASPERLKKTYKGGNDLLIKAIEQTPDTDFIKTAHYPAKLRSLQGDVSIELAIRLLVSHFNQHRAEILIALKKEVTHD